PHVRPVIRRKGIPQQPIRQLQSQQQQSQQQQSQQQQLLPEDNDDLDKP
nr:hypothetical protein [Chthoniobacterales bacterium]